MLTSVAVSLLSYFANLGVLYAARLYLLFILLLIIGSHNLVLPKFYGGVFFLLADIESGLLPFKPVSFEADGYKTFAEVTFLLDWVFLKSWKSWEAVLGGLWLLFLFGDLLVFLIGVCNTVCARFGSISMNRSLFYLISDDAAFARSLFGGAWGLLPNVRASEETLLGGMCICDRSDILKLFLSAWIFSKMVLLWKVFRFDLYFALADKLIWAV